MSQSRRKIITLEVDTDVPISVLRRVDTWAVPSVPVDGVGRCYVQVIQVSAMAAKGIESKRKGAAE